MTAHRLPSWLIAACLFMAGPALALDRSPAQREALTDLAYVLGQSHALRQACAGPDDQQWRDKMSVLLQAEAPDDSLNRRLRQSFNDGYASAQARFPSCGGESQAEAAAVAQKGRRLALGVAGP